MKPTTVFVPGKPAPQGSKRHVGRGILVESSKELGPWRERVALAIHGRAPLLDGPVVVDLMFVMPRPLSTPKSRTPPAIKRPDADKLGRAILDAMTGIAWRDDSQVVDLRARKRIAELDEIPGVRITWRPELDDDELQDDDGISYCVARLDGTYVRHARDCTGKHR